MRPSTNKFFSPLNMFLCASSFGLIVCLYIGLQIDQTKVPSSLIGKPAFDFVVENIIKDENPRKTQYTLEDFKSKVVVLNFWASWCLSCRDEARDFEALWQRYKAKDVVFLGIAIQDEINSAREFANRYGKTYYLGLDVNGNASIDYGVTGVPESFIIDRQGIIRFKETGPINPATLESQILELL